MAHYHFGYLFNPDGVVTNQCITEGTDGTKYGYSVVPPDDFGTATPNATVDGTLITELSWIAQGTFKISFGADGNTQLTDVNAIILTYNDGTRNVAGWSSTTNSYEFQDVDLATALIADYTPDKKRCFKAEILPTLFIDYDLIISQGAGS